MCSARSPRTPLPAVRCEVRGKPFASRLATSTWYGCVATHTEDSGRLKLPSAQPNTRLLRSQCRRKTQVGAERGAPFNGRKKWTHHIGRRHFGRLLCTRRAGPQTVQSAGAVRRPWLFSVTPEVRVVKERAACFHNLPDDANACQPSRRSLTSVGLSTTPASWWAERPRAMRPQRYRVSSPYSSAPPLGRKCCDESLIGVLSISAGRI